MKGDFIQMWKPNKKNGSSILRQDYERLASFIVELLKEADEVNLSDLLEAAREKIGPQMKEYHRHLLEVKQDLVERGIVHVSFGRNLKQHITLARKRRRLNLVLTGLR